MAQSEAVVRVDKYISHICKIFQIYLKHKYILCFASRVLVCPHLQRAMMGLCCKKSDDRCSRRFHPQMVRMMVIVMVILVMVMVVWWGGAKQEWGHNDIKSSTMATCQLCCSQIGQFAGERRNPGFSAAAPEIIHQKTWNYPSPEKPEIPRPNLKLSRLHSQLSGCKFEQQPDSFQTKLQFHTNRTFWSLFCFQSPI